MKYLKERFGENSSLISYGLLLACIVVDVPADKITALATFAGVLFFYPEKTSH